MREAWRRPSGWNAVSVVVQIVLVNDLVSWLVSQGAYRALGVTFEAGVSRTIANWAPIVVPTVVAPLTTVPRLRLSVRLNRAVEALQAEIERRTALQAELEYQATHDALTGTLNRRGFWERSSALVREGAVVVVVDVNDFKAVNDTYGHALGDEVLQAVGRILSDDGQERVVGRLGGDEFAAVLPTGDLRSAEDLRTRLGAMTFDVPAGGPITVSASVGIGTVGPDQTLDGALGAVDAAMYEAKRVRANARP